MSATRHQHPPPWCLFGVAPGTAPDTLFISIWTFMQLYPLAYLHTVCLFFIIQRFIHSGYFYLLFPLFAVGDHSLFAGMVRMDSSSEPSVGLDERRAAPAIAGDRFAAPTCRLQPSNTTPTSPFFAGKPSAGDSTHLQTFALPGVPRIWHCLRREDFWRSQVLPCVHLPPNSYIVSDTTLDAMPVHRLPAFLPKNTWRLLFNSRGP